MLKGGEIVTWPGHSFDDDDYFLVIPDGSSAAEAFERTWPNGRSKGEKHIIRLKDGQVYSPPETMLKVVTVVMVP